MNTPEPKRVERPAPKARHFGPGQDRALALAIAKQMVLRDLYKDTPKVVVESRQVRRRKARAG